LPDFEERFWQTYKDRGLEVVALNAHDDVAQIGEVEDFCSNLGLTYPVGLEEGTDTYGALTQNFEGLNPFPVDILIDKTGTIRYVAREYDPDAMTALIEELLAE
jgi:peroxiredoxin